MFKCKEGENLYHGVIDNLIRRVDSELQTVNGHEAVCKGAFDVLKHYESIDDISHRYTMAGTALAGVSIQFIGNIG